MGLLDKLLGREKKDAGDMAAPAMEEHSHDGTEQAPGHEH